MQVRFLAPARAEFREAVAFYNDRKAGLGFQFADQVRSTIDLIKEFPEAWSLISKRTRRCRLNRFPYAVIYQVREETILIIAVMHLHREPNSWRDRISGSLE